jgi:hypothetical protein
LEPETISYFYAPPVQNLLKTYIRDRIVDEFSKGKLNTKEYRHILDRYKVDTVIVENKFLKKYLSESLLSGFVKTYDNGRYIILKMKAV